MSAPPTLLRRLRPARPRPGRRGRALAIAALAAFAAAIAWVLLGGGSPEDGGRVRRGGATATVARQTLVEQDDVDGTLGYAGKRTVVHRSEISGGGGDSPSAAGSTPASASTATPATATVAMVTSQADDDHAEDPPEAQPEGDDDASPESPPEGDDDASPESPEGEDEKDRQPDRSGAQDDDSAQRDRDTPDASSPDSSGDDDSTPDAAETTATPTLTAVARAGSIVRRGGLFYRASGRPVVLMYGSTPAYRSLSSGVEDGRDVLQLESNLVRLGFGAGSVTVDRRFTAATAAAVREWQDALGVDETGAVALGQVVFLPGARRMGAPETPVGSLLADGTEVVATTSTRRVVKVELEASQQSLARDGERVTVTLPDGRSVNGRISSVGRVAREPDSDASGSLDDQNTGEAVIDVTVKLRSKRGTGRLDEAPVTVGLARETRRGVLAVPVTALLARKGGGYAVEVVSGGSRRTVPVRTGLFASGVVEVSGGGIAEGMSVAVPE